MSKLLETLEKYKFLFSIISLPLLVGLAQFISYIKITAYYSYFNINESFIKIIDNNNLFSLIIYLILLIFLSAEIYLFYYLIVLIYSNREIMKTRYSFIKRIFIIIFVFVLFIAGTTLINSSLISYFTENYEYHILISLACFLLAIIITIIKMIALNLIKLIDESRGVLDKRCDLALLVLTLAAFCVITVGQINDYGLTEAQNKRSFLINNDTNQIILYNDDDILIMANYEYVEESNSITIYTNELIKVNNDNMKFSTKTFDEVKVEY